MPGEAQSRELQAEVKQVTSLLKEGRSDAARARCDSLIWRFPKSMDIRLLASSVEQQRGDFNRMLERAEEALALAPAQAGAQFRVLECRLYCGQADRVIATLEEIEASAGDDHALLARIAEFFTHCTRHADALRCLRRATELQSYNSAYLFSLAAAQIATGDLEEAEQTLDHVIALDPHDYDAYRNRSTLRTQGTDDNHIDEMLALLQRGVRRPAGEAQLCYALSKEYEDLGNYEQAFSYLRRGAEKRRSLMSYRVASDVSAMQTIRQVFDDSLFQNETSGDPRPGPIFVIGLPRSGTTLIDRIIASHSEVASLGEVNDFAYSVMRTAGGGGGKMSLIERSATLDFKRLGQRYLDSTRAYGAGTPYLIDKTPLNYLYIGLIRRALPNARIVHIRRNPMDSCYGMYRTLFRAGYPFSYDFDDLARYYIAYRELMDHWHTVVPDAFLDVSYEALVADQESVTRDVIDYCGLDWEPACLEFHRNASPVATASSAQVRQPLYRDALERWRRYETQLQPLSERLQAAGIDIGQKGRTD